MSEACLEAGEGWILLGEYRAALEGGDIERVACVYLADRGRGSRRARGPASVGSES